MMLRTESGIRTMSEDDPRAIKPPQKSPVGTAARNIIEAAAEAIPFAGMATAAGRAAFPPAEEKDRDRWAGEVTGRVNEHDKVLRPTVAPDCRRVPEGPG